LYRLLQFPPSSVSFYLILFLRLLSVFFSTRTASKAVFFQSCVHE
jgi:hypothetical protein